MQYEIIFSEITGGVLVHKHPGTGDGGSSSPVRYETKRADRKRVVQRHAE